MFLDYLSSRHRQLASLAVIVAGLAASASEIWAADATPLDTDINVDGLSFTGSDPFVFGGAYSQDATAVFNGNDLLVQTQNGFGGGAGLSIPVSNGENGIDQSLDGSANEVVNPDAPNSTPANSVFATIGNASGKLENGNVVRYSMWMRSDPANPLSKAPQIEPVLKFEFWKEAFGGSVDNGNGTFQPQPFFGDKIVDTDQHQTKGIWVDIDNSGTVADATAPADGRVRTINTASWTLIEVQHVVNDADWLGIGDDLYTVADVEEIRGVMFWGDFAGTDLTNGGSLWLDNAKMEVFKNLASVTPNTSPNPSLSEGGLAGDFDSDDDVDGNDFLLIQRGLGSTTDAQDIADFRTNFGMTSPATAAVAAVPEPISASLLALAFASLAGLRRRVK